jgi:hypothetical protein
MTHIDFRDILVPVQLAISVVVPFTGVLAVTGRRRPGSARRLTRPLLAAEGLAAGCALVGLLVAAAATAWSGGEWPSASGLALLAVGSVLVQLIAQSVGTACGLLLRRPSIAMAATIVIPMAVAVALGAIDPGGGLSRWLTPYGNAQALLAAEPTGALGVVAVLWCVLPNAVGARQLRTTRMADETERDHEPHCLPDS